MRFLIEMEDPICNEDFGHRMADIKITEITKVNDHILTMHQKIRL